MKSAHQHPCDRPEEAPVLVGLSRHLALHYKTGGKHLGLVRAVRRHVMRQGVNQCLNGGNTGLCAVLIHGCSPLQPSSQQRNDHDSFDFWAEK